MFTDGLYEIHSGAYVPRAKAVKKLPCPHATLPQNTNYPLQFDKPHEAATMKQYWGKNEIVIPPLAVCR